MLSEDFLHNESTRDWAQFESHSFDLKSPKFVELEKGDLSACKKRVDLFIDNLSSNLSKPSLHLSGDYYLSIENEIVKGLYRGLFVVNETPITDGYIFAQPNSKYHK